MKPTEQLWTCTKCEREYPDDVAPIQCSCGSRRFVVANVHTDALSLTVDVEEVER